MRTNWFLVRTRSVNSWKFGEDIEFCKFNKQMKLLVFQNSKLLFLKLILSFDHCEPTCDIVLEITIEFSRTRIDETRLKDCTWDVLFGQHDDDHWCRWTPDFWLFWLSLLLLFLISHSYLVWNVRILSQYFGSLMARALGYQ